MLGLNSLSQAPLFPRSTFVLHFLAAVLLVMLSSFPQEKVVMPSLICFLLAATFELFRATQKSKQSFTDFKFSSFGLITAKKARAIST